ncbi:putative ankyrin [Operophtera brumata]|uniref:Putative ankyrin n=1 Tax=Operophtera brumata TaxID=104452 RepID=A0A0L7LGQ8_OPEBR|nr:putative ankyrin [Operophtera brumata]
MPALVSGAWPRDRRVLRTLLEMSRTPTHAITHDNDIQALFEFSHNDYALNQKVTLVTHRAAAWSGHEGVVSRLLAAGAAPERGDAEGRTPLLAAAYMGHAGIYQARDICELLLEAEADIESADACGRSALWAAAAAGHARAVRLLLASLEGHFDTVSALYARGADPDSLDADRRSIAAQEGHEECVVWLLQHGADPMQADHCGSEPPSLTSAPAQPAQADTHFTRDTHMRIILGRDKPHQDRTESVTSAPAQPAQADRHALRARHAHAHYTRPRQDRNETSRWRRRSPRRPTDTHFARDTHMHIILGRDKTEMKVNYSVTSAPAQPAQADTHFARDTHMHIILGRDKTELKGNYSVTSAPALADTHFARDTHMHIILGRDKTELKGNYSVTSAPAQPAQANTHFARDTHMHIILGRDKPHQDN